MKKILIIIGLSAITTALFASDLINGVTWTGTTTPTASKLNNSVNNATPAGWIGFVIVTNAYPNIALHPRYTNFLWLDTSSGYPATTKSYDGTNWNSSSIGVSTVTTAMLQDLAVTEAKLGNGAVTTARLANNSVDMNKIIAGNVNYTHLAANAVYSGAITNLAVTQPKLGLLSVGTAQLIDLEVTRGKMALGSVDSTLLTNGAVVAASIANNVITNSHITTDAVHSTNILDGTIVLADIAADAVAGKFVSALQAVPVGGADTGAIAHNLDGIPHSVRVVLVCNTGDLGYVSSEEVNIGSLDDANGHYGVYWIVDDTNITLYRSNVASASLYLPTKTTGAPAIFTAASWDLKVYAIYIP
jgi:hypothetical protein